jgi:apolipoprotein N-acyltransferase
MIHRGQEKPSGIRSFRVNLILLGLFGIGSYLFAFYWLFVLYWPERAVLVLALLGLVIVHMPLSFFILCPKCSYNDTCPMARVHKAVKRGPEADNDGTDAAK